MALTNQIHIYSLDTGSFYTESEEKHHRKMLRYGKYKRILKDVDVKGYSPEKYKKFRMLYKKINESLLSSKEELINTFKLNSSIRLLNTKCLIPKNVISVFESTLTRTIGMTIDELTTDIMVIQTFFYDVAEQLIKYGFMHNKEKYIYFTSSAGQIRTKKLVFIKESIWKLHEKSLMCGLTTDIINSKGGINVNKFLAYLALVNSATDQWKGFNIDRCIVVKDFETLVNGDVDYIDDSTYEITRQNMDVPITHSDGCGMILPRLSKKNFMVRLPWVKGLLASFDFHKFIREHNCSPTIKDIYGKEWNIFKDDIQVIFTESQFKMYKYYDDWQQFKDFFRQHKCQAAICNMEEDKISQATINYQMIQTLSDMTDEELDEIIKYSKIKIENMASDKKTMLNIFGVVDGNENKTYLQQALEIYPELLQDEHCKAILRQLKKSLIKKYKSAKLDVFGKYTFLIPDLYAMCENLFMGIESPKGLLDRGQVYCGLFKKSDKIDCLRSPHLFLEHAVRNNVIDDEKRKWFKTDGLYTSCDDLISRILQFDVDGDKSLAVTDKRMCEIAERNVAKYDIVPLFYIMRKALPSQLNYNTMWDGLKSAFTSGNIGVYSNDIAKIWNSDVFINGTHKEKMDALYVIKILTMENNYVIDQAKTLYKPTRPEHINELIKSFTKKKIPHYFIYAKDKTNIQVSDWCPSVVNKLDKKFKNSPLKYTIKNFGRLNYLNLMRNKSTVIDNNVIEVYKNINKKYHYQINQKNSENVAYIIKQAKDELLSTGYRESEICDMLVKHTFKDKKTPHKEILWNCFGNCIVENLKVNIPKGSIQCEKCGERFIAKANNMINCSDCQTLLRKEYRTLKQREYRRKM